MQIRSLLNAAAVLVVGAVAFVGCQSSHDHAGHHHSAQTQPVGAAKPYPLKTCLVTGEGFEHGKPYSFVRDGQEIQLCCKDCRADFDKEPAKYLQKLSAAK